MRNSYIIVHLSVVITRFMMEMMTHKCPLSFYQLPQSTLQYSSRREQWINERGSDCRHSICFHGRHLYWKLFPNFAFLRIFYELDINHVHKRPSFLWMVTLRLLTAPWAISMDSNKTAFLRAGFNWNEMLELWAAFKHDKARMNWLPPNICPELCYAP